MFLVVMRNLGLQQQPQEAPFSMQFREVTRAESFARGLAGVLVAHASCRWEVALYEVEPFCWPAADAMPELRWRCG